MTWTVRICVVVGVVVVRTSEAAFLFQTSPNYFVAGHQEYSSNGMSTLVSISTTTTVTRRWSRPSTSLIRSSATFILEQDNNSDSDNSSNRNQIVLHDHTEKLWSYFHNIQKARRQLRRRLQEQQQQPKQQGGVGSKHGNNHHHQHAAAPTSEDTVALTKPIRSLIAFFQQHPLSTLADDDDDETISSSSSTIVAKKQEREEFVSAWKGAIIEALRAAGEANDHVLILRLVDACISYQTVLASSNNISKNNYSNLRLPPRWLGEAMEALSRTQANVSKVKQLWKLALQQQQEQRLSEPLSAFELNVACKALARRNKPRAALELYRTSNIAGDAYTASTLFTILSESIQEDQAPLQEMTESNNDSLVSSKGSVCWQWNEAEVLLQEFSPVLNNHAICTALQLNERATTVFGGTTLRQQLVHHDGATIALNLFRRMMEEWKLIPDVVTCSWIMSALEKGCQYQEACALLQDMRQGGRRGSADDQTTTSSWLPLPPPNVYTYSLAISACAQCHQQDLALELLEDMRANRDPPPNTWVYNTAIAAVASSTATSALGLDHDDDDEQSASNQQPCQQPMALRLLRQMQQDSKQGLNTQPDTVTYNTVLAAFDGSTSKRFYQNVTNEDANYQAVLDLLQEMKQNGVERDCITYRHAILACQSAADLVLDLLERAIKDCSSARAPPPQRVGSETKTSNPYSLRLITSNNDNNRHSIKFVFHGAMSVLAVRGDWNRAHQILEKMKDGNVQPCQETWTYLLMALGRGGHALSIPTMLQAMQGDAVAAKTLWESTRMNVPSQVTLDVEIYSAAISACLDAHELTHALQVMSMMKSQGMAPTTASLEAITYAYARLALKAAAEETKEMRLRESRDAGNDDLVDDLLLQPQEQRVSVARAQCAFRLAQTLESAPAKLLSAVSRACAAAQLWQEGQIILRVLHGRAIREQGPRKHDVVNVLPNLHRSLLKMCASQGNITAALWYVEDIQGITRRLAFDDNTAAKSEGHKSAVGMPLNELHRLPQTVRIAGRNIGMKSEDWKLLIIAASKSGHWKVCINTLQLLQPFVEQTRPGSADEEIKKYQTYERLSRALIGTILCLEMRSQYGWVVRVMDDWIQWSGRRPPQEAVLSAFRILAARSRGEEVTTMLARVLQVPAHLSNETNDPNGASYEEILYVGAITSLHNNGLYDDADAVYLMGILQRHLAYEVAIDDSLMTLDLHGMNVAIAHAAVRITFQQEVLTSSWNQTASTSETNTQGKRSMWDKDMLIVTGRGRNSAQRMRPVLRPEIQRMLLEEFYPPLSTVSAPGNMGAIRVPAADIEAWLSHQREQRDVQLLTAANVLKELSSGNRLRRSIEMTLRKSSEPIIDFTKSVAKQKGPANTTNITAAVE
jgi:pentatricopeptide repeat protein